MSCEIVLLDLSEGKVRKRMGGSDGKGMGRDKEGNGERGG